jgi:DNA polymerase III epsilon subunit-like protein
MNNVGLYSSDHSLVFCDLICARLYDLNYQHIDIDFESYRKLYINQQLTETANKYYNKYKYRFFNQLPILYITPEDKELEHVSIKDYVKKIMSYKKMF